MAVEQLKLGVKNFGEKKKTYILLARIYTEMGKTDRPLTPEDLLHMAEEVGRCNNELKEIRNKFKIQVITISDKEYPSQLKKIYDPPLTIFVKGNIDFDYEKSIAIVGTRNASSYGKSKAIKISKDLSKRGYCIISGLARGIDGEAHTGVLEVDGKTIAVLALGLKYVYPPEHKTLSEEIIHKKGALISEMFSRASLKDKTEHITFFRERGEFKRRNRIISGLARAVLIIEGSEKSGSFSQYNYAKKQNKIIFALKPKNKNISVASLPNKIINENVGIGIKNTREIIERMENVKNKKNIESDNSINLNYFL